MEEFAELPNEVEELVDSFMSTPVQGDLIFGVTQYTFWMFIAIAVLFVVLFVFKRKQAQSLVPQGRFVNGVEYVIDFARKDLAEDIVGATWRKHFPFIATIFFFILINNLLGLIPGAHPGTGTISVTFALALISFVYFISVGVRKYGGWGYIKSLKPKGVPFPMDWLVWVIELFSTFLRLITLAVRLFCNMFAGHVVMGTFAILASLFIQRFAQGVSLAAFAGGGVSLLWLLVLIIIYLVEMLVAVIQAYVFSLLSAVYVQLAEEDE
jgi:F-type H+-transporting ATPase subunit a